MFKKTNILDAHWKRVLISTLVLLLVGFVGIFLFYRMNWNQQEQTRVSGTENPEPFLVPRVVYAKEAGKNVLTTGERKDLQDEIKTLLAEKKQQGVLTDAGVYYRDLNRGPIVAINEDLKFAPASLLKLPLAIWFYYHASSTSDYLSQEIEYTGPPGIEETHYVSPEKIQPGTVYSFQELISRMLMYSDNDATSILGQIAGIKNTDQVYKDLGLDPVSDYSTYTTDVQAYAGFFRILYYGIYLDRTSSNTLLDILSKSIFTQGIVAGVPAGIPVSHKFGERPMKGGLVQLHDCGIVYPPNKQNYILCIMTQGTSYDRQADFIAEVSRKVYSKVSE